MQVKKLLPLISLFFVAAAFAQDPQFIVERRTSGGFMPVPRAEFLGVDAQGKLLDVLYINGVPTTRQLGQLSPEVLSVLKERVAEVKVSELAPSQPGLGCADAPSVDYTVYLNGQELSIGRRMNCIDFEMKEYNSAANNIIELLNGLEAMSRL